MATPPYDNKNVPHVDTPIADLQSLTAITIRLKQGLESLAGHRGGAYDRAVTLQDLIDFGITDKTSIDKILGGKP
jgi:hypothetical protein